MFILCWSAKGGVGTTVVSASVALVSARSTPTIAVDLGGDLLAALGAAEPAGPGVTEWLAAPSALPDALLRLAMPVVDGLSVVPTGAGDASVDEPKWERLADAIDLATVIVDAGRSVPPPAIHARAAHSLLVLRPCYLALRRAAQLTGMASGIVLIREPARALDAGDVERALGAPVVAELPWDPAVARVVDAGLLHVRLPQAHLRPLRRVLDPDVAA